MKLFVAVVLALMLSGCVANNSSVQRDTAYTKAVTFCGSPSNISYFYFKKAVQAYKVSCLDGRGREL